MLTNPMLCNVEVQLHTLVMSGLAVTICFSTGNCLFCLNSTSPATSTKLKIQVVEKEMARQLSLSPLLVQGMTRIF